MHNQFITIPLTQGKSTIIDATDYALISPYHWYASRGYATCYAVTNARDEAGKRYQLRMHRLIMGNPPDKDIHHINGDGLDNRRRNLEILTREENNQNRRRHFGRDPVAWTARERDEQTVTLTSDGRALISLVGEAGRGKCAIVDAADAPLVMRYRWNLMPGSDQHFYASAYLPETQGRILLHRLIMHTPDGFVVDHKDSDGLNCTRANMENVLHEENMRNRRKSRTSASRYKGVTYRAKDRSWEASIRAEGSILYLGRFATEVDAARGYDSASRHFHGDHGRLNFPDETPAPYVPRDPLLRATNTTGYRGVVPDKRTGRWRARIYDGARIRNLGFYATAEEAAIAYDDSAYALKGDAAQLNFPHRPHGPSQVGRAKVAAGKVPATGQKNVVRVGDRFRVVIYRDRGRTRVNVGYFDTIDDAVRARDEALQE